MNGTGALVLACAIFLGGGKTFDPSTAFPGWDEASFSEWSDLYEFDRFKGPDDRDPTAAEIVELKKAWDAEKARVAKEIERIRSDPHARFAWDLRKSMKRDRFLSSIRYDTREGDLLTVFVQSPPRDQKNYTTKIERTYRPYVEALVHHFEESYAKPLGLTRRAELPSLALVVLASRGAYDDYARAQHEGAWPNEHVVAHYDPALRIAITFEQGSAADFIPERVQRHRVLHESVHALTDAFAPGGVASLKRPWITEGFAEYLGTTEGEPGNKTLTFGDLDRQAIGRIREDTSVQPLGDIVVPPLADLLAATTYADVVSLAKKRATAHSLGLDVKGAALALSAFYDTSHLLVRFLHDEDGGRWRDGFLRYLKAELEGRGGADAFRASLGVASLDEVEASFRKFLDGDGKASVSPAAPPPAAAQTPKAPAIQLEVAADLVARGQALALAKAGDAAGAVDAMRAAKGEADDVAYLEALSKLSDDVLSSAKAEDKNLVVKGAAGGVGKVARFDAKQIVLVDYKGKEIPIPRSAFGADQLVERIRSKQLRLGTPETVASTLVLVGKSVEEATKGAPSAAATVKARAERWAALSREVDAHARLARAAPLAAAESLPAETVAAYGDVDALLGDLRATQTSTANRAALLDLGDRLLGREFDRTDVVLAGFHGATKRLSNGAVEFRYSLAKPEELSDFVEDRKYQWRMLRDDDDPNDPTDSAGKWKLDGGKLASSGLSSLFHVARFAGPCSMELTLTYSGGVEDAKHPAYFFAVACDDGAGSLCMAQDLIGVVVFDEKKQRVRVGEGAHGGSIQLGKPYAVTLAHDGSEFVLTVDGKVKNRAADEGVTSGRVGLLATGDFRFEVAKLVIRGMLDPTWVAERRASWVAERRARWNER
jgi:hypothetical protein